MEERFPEAAGRISGGTHAADLEDEGIGIGIVVATKQNKKHACKVKTR